MKDLIKCIVNTKTIALLSFLSLLCALIVQHGLGFDPCAWCILQRLIYTLILLVALLGVIAPTLLTRLSFFLISILSVLGIASGMYQFIIAGEEFSCAQSIADRIINQYTKLSTYFPNIFGIYASCADAKVKILGIDFSLISVAGFTFFLILSLIGLKLYKKSH